MKNSKFLALVSMVFSCFAIFGAVVQAEPVGILALGLTGLFCGVCSMIIEAIEDLKQ